MSFHILKGCMENEKNKGCLCITPAAGDNTTEVNIENYKQSEAEIVETIPKTINQTPPQGTIFKTFQFIKTKKKMFYKPNCRVRK